MKLSRASLNPVVKDSDVMMHTWISLPTNLVNNKSWSICLNSSQRGSVLERKIMVRKAEQQAAEGNAAEQQTREIAQAHYIAMMEKHELGSEVASEHSSPLKEAPSRSAPTPSPGSKENLQLLTSCSSTGSLPTQQALLSSPLSSRRNPTPSGDTQPNGAGAIGLSC